MHPPGCHLHPAPERFIFFLTLSPLVLQLSGCISQNGCPFRADCCLCGWLINSRVINVGVGNGSNDCNSFFINSPSINSFLFF